MELWEKTAEYIKKFEQEVREEEKNKFKHALYNLDWIQILNDAIKSRPTSWAENPVIEWRNASDEICGAVCTALVMKGVMPAFVIPGPGVVKGQKITIGKSGDTCPWCRCIYDDKAKTGQGRNGGCECTCGHKSPESRGIK